MATVAAKKRKAAIAFEPELAGPGLRTFVNIAKRWDLSVKEQLILLGLISESTYYKWKNEANPPLARDTLERISYILGIYAALQVLLPDASAADTWVKRPNTAPMFGGKSALDVMLAGNVGDLYRVRQYLDAQRGGWA
jgi:uncharacterized protein (DUF2384 family)